MSKFLHDDTNDADDDNNDTYAKAMAIPILSANAIHRDLE